MRRGRTIVVVIVALGLVAAAAVGLVGLRRVVTEREAALAREVEMRRVAEEEAARIESEAIEAERRAEVARAIADFWGGELSSALGPDPQVRDLLDRASSRLDGAVSNGADLSTMPLAEASIRTTLGSAYLALGAYEAAETHVLEALEIHRRELGEAHPDTLSSISDRGVILRETGRLREAERYLLTARDGRRAVLGEAHRRTLQSIDDLAALLSKMGRYEDAEAVYREAFEGRRRSLGDDHAETLTSLNGLGVVLMLGERLEAAEPCLREALEARRRTLGDAHPQTVESMINLGVVLHHDGRRGEAEGYYREVTRRRRDTLGDEHRLTLIAIAGLGRLLREMGRYDEAEPHCRDAMEGFRRVTGDETRETLTAIDEMGAVLRDSGRDPEAEPLYREALAGRRGLLGDDHPQTLESMVGLCAVLGATGRHEEVAPLAREALERSERVLGEEHPDALAAMECLRRAEAALGRLDAAADLTARLVALRRRLADAPDATVDALDAAARLLATCEPEHLRDPAAARSYALRACELTEYEAAAYVETLAVARSECGDVGGAIEAQRQAIALLPETAVLRARYEVELAEYVEAEAARKTLDKRALRIIAAAQDPETPIDARAIRAVRDIIRMYYPSEAAFITDITYDEPEPGLRVSGPSSPTSTGVITVGKYFVSRTNEDGFARRVLQVDHELEHIRQRRRGLGGRPSKDLREFLAFHREALAPEVARTGRVSHSTRVKLIDAALEYYYKLDDEQQTEHAAARDALLPARAEHAEKSGREHDPPPGPRR